MQVYLGKLYTNKQWEWLADRYREGYSVREIRRFLELSRCSVSHKLTRMVKQEERQKNTQLVPLWMRKEEFYAVYEE